MRIFLKGKVQQRKCTVAFSSVVTVIVYACFIYCKHLYKITGNYLKASHFFSSLD